MAWDFKTRPELPNSQMDFYYWQSPHKQIFTDFRALVVKVHDGDTITLRVDWRNFDFPLRLFGIDSPELNKPRGTNVRDWLKEQIEGKLVTIIMNPKQRTEKWGRLLGRVMHGGMEMGEAMLRLGMVTTFEQRRAGELPNVNLELNIKKWF